MKRMHIPSSSTQRLSVGCGLFLNKSIPYTLYIYTCLWQVILPQVLFSKQNKLFSYYHSKINDTQHILYNKQTTNSSKHRRRIYIYIYIYLPHSRHTNTATSFASIMPLVSLQREKEKNKNEILNRWNNWLYSTLHVVDSICLHTTGEREVVFRQRQLQQSRSMRDTVHCFRVTLWDPLPSYPSPTTRGRNYFRRRGRCCLLE